MYEMPTPNCLVLQDKWRNLTAETLPKPASGPKPLYKDPSVAPVLKVPFDSGHTHKPPHCQTSTSTHHLLMNIVLRHTLENDADHITTLG